MKHNNCVESVRGALAEYDGCEFDLRLTGDSKLMLFHNPKFKGKRVFHSRSKDLKGLDAFGSLLKDPEVVRLVNDEGKTLWIEAKEDSGSFLRSDQGFCKKMARSIVKELKASDLDLERVQVISFCPDILYYVKGVKRMRIFPYLYGTTRATFPSRNHRTVFNILTSLGRHIDWSQKKGFDGILFSKRFIRGFFSNFSQDYEKLLRKNRADFKLVTEADTREEEEFFSGITTITDYRGKRGKKKRKGPLICHRGLGENPRY